MSNETFWAIRRRERAKHAEPDVVEKPVKAKKEKAVGKVEAVELQGEEGTAVQAEGEAQEEVATE